MRLNSWAVCEAAALRSLGRTSGDLIRVMSRTSRSKAELDEEFKINATPAEIADALLAPVTIRWIDKPRSRCRKR